jgi:8-oxo-dGTP diphosphatase
VRELEEETGLRHEVAHLEQLATYGTPGRDPRGRTVAVAYLAFVPDSPDPVAGDDAAAARFRPVGELLGRRGKLAFDHARILADGVERARAKIEYSPLATAFCPDPFTVHELRRVYEAVWGAALDPRNFHRKVTGTPGFLEPVGETTTRNGGRPAQLYRRGSTTVLTPPLTRIAAGA